MNFSHFQKRKRMLRAFSVVFLTLSSLSLVGVGFSSWVTSELGIGVLYDSKDININSSYYIDVNPYISYGSITTFNFCEDGIYVPNDDQDTAPGGIVKFIGDIVVNFNINLNDSSKSISSYLGGQDTLNLNIYYYNLNTNCSNLLSSIESTTLTYKTSNDDSSVSSFINQDKDYGPTNSNNTYKILYKLKENLDSSKLYFTLTYSFDFSSYETNFKEKIYTKLGGEHDSNNNLKFQIQARVEL